MNQSHKTKRVIKYISPPIDSCCTCMQELICTFFDLFLPLPVLLLTKLLLNVTHNPLKWSYAGTLQLQLLLDQPLSFDLNQPSQLDWQSVRNRTSGLTAFYLSYTVVQLLTLLNMNVQRWSSHTGTIPLVFSKSNS